jgi:hypothetical protein
MKKLETESNEDYAKRLIKSLQTEAVGDAEDAIVELLKLLFACSLNCSARICSLEQKNQ